jgi:hypothetical protein
MSTLKNKTLQLFQKLKENSSKNQKENSHKKALNLVVLAILTKRVTTKNSK